MSNKNQEKRIKKLEKAVRRNTPELRNSCSELAATAIGTSGVLYDLTYLAGGTDNQQQRIGDSIKLMNLQLKYIITQGQTSSYGGVFVRWILARSKSGELTAADFPTSYYGCPDRDRYYVLEDRLTDLRASANNGAGVNVGFTHEKVYANKRYKKGQVIRYNDANGSSIGNGLYLFVWAQGTATQPTIAGYHNLQYHDN